MSQEAADLSVVFVEPPKWTAPAPEVREQLKPPKKKQGRRGAK